MIRLCVFVTRIVLDRAVAIWRMAGAKPPHRIERNPVNSGNDEKKGKSKEGERRYAGENGRTVESARPRNVTTAPALSD